MQIDLDLGLVFTFLFLSFDRHLIVIRPSIFHIAEQRRHDVWGREGIWIYDATCDRDRVPEQFLHFMRSAC